MTRNVLKTSASFAGGYSERALDHYENPRNVGAVEHADAAATVSNPGCGDTTSLSLRIRGGVIEDARFRTYGCAAAIAASSAATELIKGKAIEAASRMSPEAVADALGGLPPMKMHGAVLAEDAIKAALAEYRRSMERGAEGVPTRAGPREGPAIP